jgi:putative PIN family toxin of toxin-antitoxin system
MIQAVLDTNVIVSALLQPLGPSARILVLALSGAFQFCVSGAIYDEYEEVLRRPRLKLKEPIIVETLAAIRRQGRWIKTPPHVSVCPDPDDDIFIACAAVVKAHYIVTGNVKDFPSRWEATIVVTPRQFLEIEFPEAG